MLSYQDSNLDKQNQKLLCYHYTIGQNCGAKVLFIYIPSKFFVVFLLKNLHFRDKIAFLGALGVFFMSWIVQKNGNKLAFASLFPILKITFCGLKLY